MPGDRVIKVSGEFRLDPKDGAYGAPLSEIIQDGKDGMWGISELEDLTFEEYEDK